MLDRYHHDGHQEIIAEYGGRFDEGKYLVENDFQKKNSNKFVGGKFGHIERIRFRTKFTFKSFFVFCEI